jgi:hypothetical protein
VLVGQRQVGQHAILAEPLEGRVAVGFRSGSWRPRPFRRRACCGRRCRPPGVPTSRGRRRRRPAASMRRPSARVRRAACRRWRGRMGRPGRAG